MLIKFYAAALLAAVFCATGATAQQRPERPDPAAQAPRRSMAEIVMRPVVYKVPGMDRVSVRRDIVYKSGDPRLKMDVYAPPGLAAGERRPAVLFIHGGTGPQTNPKDWGIFVSWGRLVAASGMAAVTFTHRLGFPKTRLTEAPRTCRTPSPTCGPTRTRWASTGTGFASRPSRPAGRC